MDSLEVIVGTAAFIIAGMAFMLQKKEVQKNGRINALVHSSNLIQQKIDYYEKIIDDMKKKSKPYEDWNGLAQKINEEYRPLKKQVDNELLEMISQHENEDLSSRVIHALNLNK